MAGEPEEGWLFARIETAVLDLLEGSDSAEIATALAAHQAPDVAILSDVWWTKYYLGLVSPNRRFF